MVARFDGLITAVETGVAGDRGRERGRERERGLCASVRGTDKLARIVSARLKWN